MEPSTPWGTHVEFVQRYERRYLEATLNEAGRAGLVASIGAAIQERGVKRLLDCAAGTGFPALDLIEAAGDVGLDTVHVCDGDRTMLRELVHQAKRRRVRLEPLNPRLRQPRTDRQALDDLVIDWRDLSAVRGTYDYVMCRGNALAYANTWNDEGNEVAPVEDLRELLASMADKIEVGGYLHIDATWKLTPRPGPMVVLDSTDLLITEQIKDNDDHREWLLHFTEHRDSPKEARISFRRLSSHLTIHDVRRALDALGTFEETEPFQMKAERVVYGTIIARKRG